MRVLYVEDDPYDASPYIAAMQARAVEVVHVKSAGEALKTIAEDREFDAVVLDIRLPRARHYGVIETAGGFRTGLRAASGYSTERSLCHHICTHSNGRYLCEECIRR
jgi:CheY-like chemotaxis protein